MSRSLRGLLLGSIAIAFLYLLVHAREPLRLNLGDPGSDADILTSIHGGQVIHYPPFAEFFYGAVSKFLGVSDIATLRLFALMFSGLAMWLLFSYVRRLYADRIALITTALFTTSLLWMTYADSVHQMPITQCSGFLALWGLVRAIETKQRRHQAAAFLGSFACFFASFDYYVFLPTAVLATIYLKAGNPFARKTRHLVALCALGGTLGLLAGCLCVLGAVGWGGLVTDVRDQLVERVISTDYREFASVVPTMIRRITLVLTPFAWIPLALHVGKAIRAPNLATALRATAVWLLVPALVFLGVFAQFAASQMLASQVLLPFYAIGSALVLDRLLDGDQTRRGLAFAWLVAAPLWSFYFMFTHPRSVLDRDEVAKTNVYLAANDHNDFVLSNLLSDGPLQASFQRHRWPALDVDNGSDVSREMMRIFEVTGTDSVHAIIFTGPASRFIDKSLWALVIRRGLWSITGWPHVVRTKANAAITEYDRRVMKNLKALQATKVLQLSNYTVFRVDRAAVLAMIADPVPTANHIDFASVTSLQHELLGWGYPGVLEDGTPANITVGLDRCPTKPCKTVQTRLGAEVPSAQTRSIGQVMIRVDPVCDLRLTFTFAKPGWARFSINKFSAGPTIGNPVTFTVPAAHLTKGVNVLELRNMVPRVFGSQLRASALDLEPACAAP